MAEGRSADMPSRRISHTGVIIYNISTVYDWAFIFNMERFPHVTIPRCHLSDIVNIDVKRLVIQYQRIKEKAPTIYDNVVSNHGLDLALDPATVICLPRKHLHMCSLVGSLPRLERYDL